ncbi:MAG: hemolysin III family protein [Cyclobacteriaceae bacterium]
MAILLYYFNNSILEMGTEHSVKSPVKTAMREEIANAITHGIGAILALIALVFLIIYANEGSKISFSIYGITLVLLYLMSTLYHSLSRTRAANLFRKFDHMAIFLLIAGTYTPFCLTILDGWLRWTMLGTVWGCAILGIILKSLFTGKFEWLSVLIYIVTGWMVMVAIKPMYEFLSPTGFTLLVSGGLAYTIGTFFYVTKRIRYNHSIWHLWVLAGSAFHFFAVMSLL